MPTSKLESYGGFAFLSRVVMDFYDRVLDSDRLGPIFGDVDMRRLIDHQTKFVASLMGGPASYTNDQLRSIHAHLDIDREAFDEVVATFTATLREHRVTRTDVDAIAAEFRSREPYIVTVVKT